MSRAHLALGVSFCVSLSRAHLAIGVCFCVSQVKGLPGIGQGMSFCVPRIRNGCFINTAPISKIYSVYYPDYLCLTQIIYQLKHHIITLIISVKYSLSPSLVDNLYLDTVDLPVETSYYHPGYLCQIQFIS